jgi:hypothetical protein
MNNTVMENAEAALRAVQENDTPENREWLTVINSGMIVELSNSEMVGFLLRSLPYAEPDRQVLGLLWGTANRVRLSDNATEETRGAAILLRIYSGLFSGRDAVEMDIAALPAIAQEYPTLTETALFKGIQAFEEKIRARLHLRFNDQRIPVLFRRSIDTAIGRANVPLPEL